MPQITASFSEETFNALKKRAKKNLFSVSELIEDITRRSMLSYKQASSSSPKVDDRLVEIFSRQKKRKR